MVPRLDAASPAERAPTGGAFCRSRVLSANDAQLGGLIARQAWLQQHLLRPESVFAFTGMRASFSQRQEERHFCIGKAAEPVVFIKGLGCIVPGVDYQCKSRH